MSNIENDRALGAAEADTAAHSAKVQTFALGPQEDVEETSLDSRPHAQPKAPVAYDANTMVRNGEDGNIQDAARESGFAIGGSSGGLTAAEREEKKKEDERHYEAIADAIQEQRERQEAHAKEWDNATHGFGGQQMSGTKINAIYDWFSKKENEEKVRKQLAEQGKTQQEIEEAIRKFKESQTLWEKMRFGTATEEEKKRYEQIMQDPAVQHTALFAAKGQEADAEKNNELKTSSDQKSKIDALQRFREQSDLLEKAREGTLTAEEQNQYQNLSADAEVQAIANTVSKKPEGGNVGPSTAANNTTDFSKHDESSGSRQPSSAQNEKGNARSSATEDHPGYSDFPSAAALKVQENFQAAVNGNEPPTHAAPSHKPLTTASLSATNKDASMSII